jgi:hypothetical protein
VTLTEFFLNWLQEHHPEVHRTLDGIGVGVDNVCHFHRGLDRSALEFPGLNAPKSDGPGGRAHGAHLALPCDHGILAAVDRALDRQPPTLVVWIFDSPGRRDWDDFDRAIEPPPEPMPLPKPKRIRKTKV